MLHNFAPQSVTTAIEGAVVQMEGLRGLLWLFLFFALSFTLWVSFGQFRLFLCFYTSLMHRSRSSVCGVMNEENVRYWYRRSVSMSMLQTRDQVCWTSGELTHFSGAIKTRLLNFGCISCLRVLIRVIKLLNCFLLYNFCCVSSLIYLSERGCKIPTIQPTTDSARHPRYSSICSMTVK